MPSDASEPDPGLSVPWASLSSNQRKARYGVAYLKTICAQAGVGIAETPPDEDVLAVDCAINFPKAPARVQVKCSSRSNISGTSASWPLEDSWIRSWSESWLPVYFVLVLVPKNIDAWMAHEPEGTMHNTAAFWRRIQADELDSSISIPKANRLTVDTLAIWHEDVRACFTPGEAT